jgi:hypothetical protein
MSTTFVIFETLPKVDNRTIRRRNLPQSGHPERDINNSVASRTLTLLNFLSNFLRKKNNFDKKSFFSVRE